MTGVQVFRLFANENCYGCSDTVLTAMLSVYNDVYFYPDSNHFALKEKLADKHGVNSQNIVIGAGSVNIIDCLIQSFSEVGDEVITFENTFVMYEHLAISHKRICRFAALTDLRCNPLNLTPLINNRTRLIFIANPNNPTGTTISHTELEDLLNWLPVNILVVVDEAYSEYTTALTFPDSISLQRKFPNLAILHSFSKIYGMAGLRIGYGIVEESIASKIHKVQIPNSVNYLAPAAAIAALNDVEFINESIKKNETERTYLFNALVGMGYNTIASQANFLYLWFEDEVEKRTTLDILITNGIEICDLKIYGQERALRITIGTNIANRKIVQVLSNQ